MVMINVKKTQRKYWKDSFNKYRVMRKTKFSLIEEEEKEKVLGERLWNYMTKKLRKNKNVII